MKLPLPLLVLLPLVVILSVPGSAAVVVSAPTNGATVGSPVPYAATATTGCSKGVASMGIYVDNTLEYVVNGASLNTSLPISSGSHNTVVEEWDYCGGASYTAVAITVTNQTGVWVTSPSNNSSDNDPVSYVAAATSTCSKGVASMGIYVNNQLTYVVGGSSLNTSIVLAPGTYNTVVEEWDYCGGASYTPIKVTVTGNVFTNLQASGGWVGYGEFPPNYDTCTDCGPGVTWAMTQGVKSPSLSGDATEFQIGGTTPYSDVLWTNPLIGTNSSQGMPDPNHQLVPNLYNFIYDAYFYGADLALSQVLEFDINQYFNGMGFTWGNQCRIAGGNEFDVWDNVHAKWVPTGVPCYPASNKWNHVTLQVQRTSNNWLRYHSITLNGVTTVLDWYFPPFSAGNWYGISANYQMDGNYQQASYSVLVDQLSFIYW